LLAAGNSSRLGTPKQLLQFNKMSLLNHAVMTASLSAANEIIVVLGSNAVLLEKELADTNARVVINEDWKVGMGSSVVRGVKELVKMHPFINGVIFMMCDQPHVTSELLNDLISTHIRTGKNIVTSSFNGVPGPPALFERRFFAELMQLEGDAGARKIIQQNMHETETVVFPEGNIDIDTVEDYEALIKSTEAI
jgi:molybdenum cofactor cytidylyltransferase